MIAAAIRTIFQATSLAEARQRLAEVVDRRQPAAPKVAGLLEAAESELLASRSCPRALVHTAQHQPAGTRQPRDRSAHRRGGIFPTDTALLRLAGALLIEQNDEWLIARRSLSQESLELVLADEPPPRRPLSPLPP